MAKKSEQLTLDELRDKSVKSKTKLSFGKEMGGYNKKQVTEYIDNLTDSLSSAEESFNNRLEEYAAMITMLKQERDQYGEMYNLCKSSKGEMANQIDALKRENEELNRLVNELSINPVPQPVEVIDTHPGDAAINSQTKLEEYLSYEQESQEMKAQLDQLKAMVRELSTELEAYASTNLSEITPASGSADQQLPEKDVLKYQYEDILKERRALITENNQLIKTNEQLSDEVMLLKAQIATLEETANQKIQQAISTYQSKTDAFIKNHQITLAKLSENMINSLHLIETEGDDFITLKNMLLIDTIQSQ
ncbi:MULTISPECIES: hypothetical protein [Acetobacterium]|jgi:cell division septum initiation protein DivIVA|uniref:Uncharacterized protein n=1 Tax=Acetobacterium wieringae TaxID=52694 RepID=A0A5D0WT14_9FIRM|nr:MULTISPECIES: hypothetical protein [Acetobacterium]MEA4806914.1 hypothetical protein [Acetobacterium wieringae]TYC87156.1 hypothetical protein FXB42_05725 [Acetobacterium wieringae]URN86089.1 hypothetical protein CHL1_001777 [Acetobacterium wieringae]